MTRRRQTFPCVATLLAVCILAAPALAGPAEHAKLFEAYYLEKEGGDFGEARQMYQEVIDAGLPPAAEQAARAGLSRCRDRLAAENFATLMPEDALAYFELRRPGRILEELAGMLGLTGKDIRVALSERPSADSNAPFHIPSEIVISPAIFDALGSFGGAGLAITDFDPENDSASGVLVVHHGDVAMLKGVLEMAFQFAPTATKIGDLPTFGVQVPDLGRVTGVLTESLLIVGTGRDLVEGVVNRLTGAVTTSLASREDLKEVGAQRAGATLFCYVDLHAALEIAKANLAEHDLHEFQIADALCDLDSLRWATFSVGIQDEALGFQFAVSLADGHRNMAYNLLRLPPMSRKCLHKVPVNAAALFGLGLNPVLSGAAASAVAPSDAEVTGFDLGREFFGNIQEICGFIIPGDMGQSQENGGSDPIPNVGIVLAVNDVARSRALWNQLLSIPGLVAGEKPIEPKALKIGKHEATAYVIPDFTRVYLAEVDHCITIGLTRRAIKASLRAHDKGKSILDDAAMSGVIADMPPGCSIMAVAHAGRLAEVAIGAGDAGVAAIASQVAPLCANTIGWFGLGQAPTLFTLRAAVKGLPNVNDAVKKFGPMANAFAPMMQSVSHRTQSKEPAREDVGTLTRKLVDASRRGDHEAALKYALKAREIADTGHTNYNVCCMHSLLGQEDEAFEYLDRAVVQGLGDAGQDLVALMQRDTDLDNIRDDPRYEKALAIAKGALKTEAKAKKPARAEEPKRTAKAVEL